MSLSKKKKNLFGAVGTHICLILICILIDFPVFWMGMTSFKSNEEAIQFPPRWLPENPTLENYVFAWTDMKFGRYFLNTVYVAGMTVILALTLGALAGYGFARFRIKGKRPLLISILFSRMLPAILFIVPLFFLIQYIGLFDRLEGLILSFTTIALPFTVWMMKGYFETIPQEIEEAALIDGCSRIQAFYRVILPLSAPALAATAIFSFVSAWNEFMFANTFIHSEEKRTLVVALYASIGDYLIQWNTLMAASIFTMIPIFIAFFLVQRYLVEGLTAGSIKG